MSFILSGAVVPVSKVASIVQAMADAMICCAFNQLVRDGALFVLDNFLYSKPLESGTPTFGMPEPVFSNYVIGHMAWRLGLPLRCWQRLTASKIKDAQGDYESAASIHSTMLAGARFVLHAAGWMESGLCTESEKLAMDTGRLGADQKFLQGLDVSAQAFAHDACPGVKSGGHFFGSTHTLRNYQTALFELALSKSDNMENWEDGGSLGMRQRSHERRTNLLDQNEVLPLDPVIYEALQEFVAQRKSESPYATY